MIYFRPLFALLTAETPRFFTKKLYLCSRNFNLNTYLVMARPIKETPILYGEDARRFEARIKEHRRISPEERARMNAAYEAVKSVCDFM